MLLETRNKLEIKMLLLSEKVRKKTHTFLKSLNKQIKDKSKLS